MNNGTFKKGNIPWNKGKTGTIRHTDEFKEKKREQMKGNAYSVGKTPWNKGLHYNIGHKFKKGNIPWNKGKKFPQVSGENNRNWRGGVTPEHEKIRKSPEYKRWRKEVLERDGYMCTKCGVKLTRRTPLIVDHIKPFCFFPDQRLSVLNGRSLCRSCDKIYGFRWNRHLSYEENYQEYIALIKVK